MKKLNVEYARNDSRGSLIQVSSGKWEQLNHLIIKAGNSFGGHYHKLKTELFYCLMSFLFVVGKIQCHQSVAS